MNIRKGSILIVVAAVLWALDGIVRRSLYSLPPLVIVSVEHLVGSILILPFIFKGIQKERFNKKEWLALGAISLFSGLLGTLWFTTALLMTNYISFSVVFLLQKLQPIFALLAARILLKEKLSKEYVFWAVCALIAAFLVTFPTGSVNLNTGDKTLQAAVFALGAAVVWGASTALSRYVLLKHNDRVVSGMRFFITTLLSFIALLLFGQLMLVKSVTPIQLGQFIFIAVSTGMVALLLYYKGLKSTPVRVSTLLELTFPLLAIGVDYFLYNTVISPIQIVSGAILLFSLYNVSKKTI
ncbi:MAG: DMT family transporter [Microgenomates group bacterium]